MGTQSIFRLEVEQGAERSHLRLVLRLWTPGRFELVASDSFGRTLWRLALVDSRGFWVGERGREVCRLAADRALRWPELGLVLPADQLPALLLGRLPEAPAGTEPPPGPGPVRWVDPSGRNWEITRDAWGLASWTLEAEGKRLDWRRTGQGGRLELGDGEVSVEWRLAAREVASGGGPVLPAGAATARECRGDQLP